MTDFVDTIVIQELKRVYAGHCMPNRIDNSNDLIDPDWDFLRAVATMLEYYMTPIEYKQWLEEQTHESSDAS